MAELLTRRRDEELTRRVESLADALYYEDGLSKDIYRVTDIPMQKEGIDMIMDTPDGPMYIDEKMAINKRHKNLATYILELSSENNVNHSGWFTSDTTKTTHYAFTWFQSDQEIDNVTSYETAIVSKQAIKAMLIKDGINPDTIRDEFLHYLEDYQMGKDLPDGVSIIPKYKDGSIQSYAWRIGEYKIVHSVDLQELPINIVVPKEKLQALADLEVKRYGNIAVQPLIEKTNSRTRPDMPILSTNELRQLAREERLSGELSLVNQNGTVKTGKLKSAKDMDMLCIGKTPNDLSSVVAIYSEKINKWLVTRPDFPKIDNPKFISLQEYIKQELSLSHVPETFKVTDKYHIPIPVERLTNSPQDGDVVYCSGQGLNGEQIHLTYHKALDSFSINHNSIINSQDLSSFMGKPVIDDKMLQLQRAVGNRIIYELRNACSEQKISYSKTNEQELQNMLPDVLKRVQQSTWTSNRYSDLEQMIQSTTSEQRKELFAILSYPELVADLASAISKMNRDERNLPINLSSFIYEKGRAEHYQQLAEQRAIQQTISQAYKSKPINLEGKAKDIPGVKTFMSIDKRTGVQNERVSWNTWTVHRTAQEINLDRDFKAPLVLSGAAPMWAMTAVANQIEGPVYIKQNQYCVPIKSVPQAEITMTPTESGTLKGKSVSQGIAYEIEQGKSAVSIDLSIADPRKSYFSEINMTNLQMPAIHLEPGQDVYLTGKCHPAVFAAIAKTAKDMGFNVYLENKYERGFTCSASLDKAKIGEFHTQNDKTASFTYPHAQELARADKSISRDDLPFVFSNEELTHSR